MLPSHSTIYSFIIIFEKIIKLYYFEKIKGNHSFSKCTLEICLSVIFSKYPLWNKCARYCQFLFLWSPFCVFMPFFWDPSVVKFSAVVSNNLLTPQSLLYDFMHMCFIYPLNSTSVPAHFKRYLHRSLHGVTRLF